MNGTSTKRRMTSRSLLLAICCALQANAANAQSTDTIADREALKRQLQEMNLSSEQAESALARRIELMRQADANNDGMLTRAELEATLQSQFTRLDRNADGRANEDDAPVLAGRNRFTARLSPLIAEQDADGDGALSQVEFTSRPLSVFDAIDEDDDGQVDLDAINEHFKAHSRAGQS